MRGTSSKRVQAVAVAQRARLLVKTIAHRHRRARHLAMRFYGTCFVKMLAIKLNKKKKNEIEGVKLDFYSKNDIIFLMFERLTEALVEGRLWMVELIAFMIVLTALVLAIKS